ncbi:MAG: NTP transferase domain-containing protein [Gemmatimonadota bacterium]|nr:MAG: NTP transferase domain-containing protein [Gemmatimonadota bacterium]
MRLTLVVLAAGISSRYGALKQTEPVGPSGETLMDYAVFDAMRAGFSKVVFIIREEIEPQIRAHVEPRFAAAIQIAFRCQSLHDVPPGYTTPPTRRKPWGTAHAVLAAAQDIDGPFAVCNADDYYGASAYRKLSEHFTTADSQLHGFVEEQTQQLQGDTADLQANKSGTPSIAGVGRHSLHEDVPHVLIGYRLRETLSEFGGVSRAICRSDPAGYLEQLVEVKQIEEHRGLLAGVTESGERIELSGGETVSMNLWGFTAAVLPVLRAQFEEFLEAHGASADKEFLIPTALNQQIARNQARLRVLEAQETWIGMTFTRDRSQVAQHIGELVRQGCYPKSLATELRDSQQP